MPNEMNRGAAGAEDKAVAMWLFACCFLVFAMISIGGITRLTHSGLSIVEWQPLVGALPPLTEVQWEETFAKYRQTPEYKQVNQGMSLDSFKGIFWWEYLHRLLGRLIGAAFLLPLLWFAWRGAIRRRLLPRLLGIFVLGGLQGALGWYMVASGLVDDPRVSQYRLTAHLLMAFLIYAAMLWLAMDLYGTRVGHQGQAKHSHALRRHAWAILCLVLLMVITGGFVAGIRAGFAYNTFPLMNGNLFPPEMFLLEPWYLNFFSNMATVQFDHRLFAWILAVVVPWFWIRTRAEEVPPRIRSGATWLLMLLALQITLGIATLLLVVPVPLAAAHQACAVLVFSAALYVLHSLG